MSDQQPGNAVSPFVAKLPMRASVLVATGLILLGLVALFAETYNMVPSILPGYPGDASFPRMVLVFTIFWAVLILVRGLLLSQTAAAEGDEAPFVSFHWLEFASVCVLVLLFARLLEPVGFEAVSVAFMMVLLVPRFAATMPARRAVLQSLALSVATMLILYLAFGPFLKIALPLAFLPIYF